MDQGPSFSSLETRRDIAPTFRQPLQSRERSEFLGSIDDEVAKICDVDLQDRLRARQMKKQTRIAPASSSFVCLEDLLLNQPDPTPGENIALMIKRDFSSPPFLKEDEEELAAYDPPPWFRFRRKRIKTYSRKKTAQNTDLHIENEEDEDRMSCTSELSVQEDLNSTTTAVVCELDANTSQRIRENLLNLSQYFSLGSPNSKTQNVQALQSKIDLPTKTRRNSEQPSGSRNHERNLSGSNSTTECICVETNNETKNCDIKPEGFLGATIFGESMRTTAIESDIKVCDDWSEADSFLEIYNTERLLLDGEIENADILVLEDIPVSEWQTSMELPDESVKENEEALQRKLKIEPISQENPKMAEDTNLVSDIQFLKEIHLDEWQPELEPAPKTSLHVSAEMQEMEGHERKTEVIPEFVGFRTASDKPIKVSEEMKKRAAKFLSDFEEAENHHPKSPADQNDANFDVPEEMQETEPHKQKREDIPEFVGFRTASDKPIKLSEKMKERAAKFLSDFEAAETNPFEREPDRMDSNQPKVFVGFQTASNKPIKITKEMEAKGAHFLAQFKATDEINQVNDDQYLQDFAFSEWQPIDISGDVPSTSKKLTEVPKSIIMPISNSNTVIAGKENQQVDLTKIKEDEIRTPNKTQSPTQNIPQLVGFRKTPYKFIDIPKEMKNMGDRLMSEVESGLYQPSQKHNSHTKEISGNHSREFVGFRTASNKPIKVSEEMKKKAAKLMDEVVAEDLNHYSGERPADDFREIFGFRTASNKRIEISEETRIRAAQLMADIEIALPPEVADVVVIKPGDSDSNKSDDASGEDFHGFPLDDGIIFSMDEDDNDSIFPRLSQKIQNSSNLGDDSSVVTPKHRRETSDGIPSSKRRCSETPSQLTKTTSFQSGLNTPPQSQQIHASLSQLAERSPLDKKTKSSIIARRNLLSLSKIRKRSRTPVKPKCAPLPVSTSTPLADKNSNLVENSDNARLIAGDMSPICMQNNKSRRLGLSRSRY
ncbi:breast cancer type 2 susceptibility protein homolog [Drosophila ficusphila]|uniref:breast cancer type 2 susceptibility protein homolog n=1 Tax=Drosophila ficusphila TaxID=30025 RepID=UPI0007E5BFAE|nr:breast cancer type 2 susceptibility protein homolog [Drosophila ficusphila]